MKRTRCQYGAAILISLLVAVGAVNLVPRSLLIESSSAIAVLEAAMPSDVNDTLVLTPVALNVFWGWKGNITFVYWDVAMDTGIANATVVCQGCYPELDAIDYNNGTYIFEIDTTGLSVWLNPYALLTLVITFEEENYEAQVVTYLMWIHPVPTEVEIQVPEFNLSYSCLTLLELTIPVGESINLRFFYNDTDSSDGYVGGLPGAEATVTLYGPTLVRRDTPLTDYGNGTYSFLFNTSNSWLFEATGGVPFPHELPYYLETKISLENRTAWEGTIRIFIIDTPTELEALGFDEGIFVEAGGIFTVSLRYYDVWSGHDPMPISNASVFVECSAPNALSILRVEEDMQEAGIYHIDIISNETGPYPEEVFLTITFEKENYETQSETIRVQVYFFPPPPPPPWPSTVIPTIITITVAWYCYRRNKERLFPAGPIEEDAVHPTQAPNRLESKGPAIWYRIYFVLVTLVGIGLFLYQP